MMRLWCGVEVSSRRMSGGWRLASLTARCRRSASSRAIVDVHTHCSELTKKADYEAYLACLLLPTAEARQAGFALRAFNVETAMIKDTVTQPELGQMRLAWWREVIGEMFDGRLSSNQPVAGALFDVMRRQRLTKGWFLRLLDRRIELLDEAQPVSVQQVEQNAEETHASLLYLQLEALGVRHVDADHIASHVGKAVGIATLLRALPITLGAREIALPQQLLATHDLSTEQLLRGEQRERLAACVFELATVAHQHLQHARAVPNGAPAHARYALLAAVPTQLFLERLQRARFDVYDASLHRRPLRLYWRLWRNAGRPFEQWR